MKYRFSQPLYGGEKRAGIPLIITSLWNVRLLVLLFLGGRVCPTKRLSAVDWVTIPKTHLIAMDTDSFASSQRLAPGDYSNKRAEILFSELPFIWWLAIVC